MSAIQRGKHVFVQKPLTHDIYEARRLKEAAAKAQVATQMGIQGTAQRSNTARRCRSSAMGPSARSNASMPGRTSRRASTARPARARRARTPSRRRSTGTVGSARLRCVRTKRASTIRRGGEAGKISAWGGWATWAATSSIRRFQALKLTAPLSIRAEVEPAWWDTPARRAETWPTWQILHYTFPGTELTAGNTLEFTWSDGDKYPPDAVRAQIDNQEYPAQGSLLIGEAGSLLVPHVAQPAAFPQGPVQGLRAAQAGAAETTTTTGSTPAWEMPPRPPVSTTRAH